MGKEKENGNSNNMLAENEKIPLKAQQAASNSQTSAESCMGCKVVAYTTPIIVSIYIMQTVREKKKQSLPFAVDWKGKELWRWKLHKFNMLVVAPLAVCYIGYSYLFKFGPFRQDFEPAKFGTKEQLIKDKEIFIKGNSELWKWTKESITETSRDSLETVKGIFSRLRKMVLAPANVSVDDMNKPDSSKSDSLPSKPDK